MRWGVRDEATDDHMTTELCMKEIENCQRVSIGPNFVVRTPLHYHRLMPQYPFSPRNIYPYMYAKTIRELF